MKTPLKNKNKYMVGNMEKAKETLLKKRANEKWDFLQEY